MSHLYEQLVSRIHRPNLYDSKSQLKSDLALFHKLQARCSLVDDDQRIWLRWSEIDRIRQLAQVPSNEVKKKKNRRLKATTVRTWLDRAEQLLESRVVMATAERLTPFLAMNSAM